MKKEFNVTNFELPQTMWPFSEKEFDIVSKILKLNVEEIQGLQHPWEALILLQNKLIDQIAEVNISTGAEVSDRAHIEGPAWIEEGVKVLPFAVIVGPVFIGKNTLVGNHTQIRNSFVGSNSIVGAGTEVVRSICIEDVKLHRNYVGDSFLGANIVMGGNSALANERMDGKSIFSTVDNQVIDTGLTKLGAIIGSNTTIAGANAVTMPGVKVGSNCLIGPGVILFKDLPNNSKIKVIQGQEITEIT